MLLLLLLSFANTFKVFPSHFEINGKPTLLRSGSLQWYRMPKSEWRDRLTKFAGIYNVLEMYASWQYIEPRENEFHTDDLLAFLNLVKEYNLYVYFRPGPYICNEENSGGFPGWVIGKSNKVINPYSADGFYALRTNDYDYLQIVKRYFDVVNRVIQPFLITNGGFIVLYQIENEFDHYERIFQIEKASMYNGEPERALNATLDTFDMFTKLRKMVEPFIDIPINTCPGTIELNGMGNTQKLMPFPNYYKDANILEYAGMQYKHNQQNKVNYMPYPSGITETFRSASTTSRFIISGMDMVNNFNAFGMYQEGRKNTMIGHFKGVVDTNEYSKILKLVFPMQDIRDYRSLYFRFPIGLFPSVIDFNGPVSPSGQLRSSYFNFRRLHLFYNTFQHLMAPVHKCKRSTSGSKQRDILYSSKDVIVRNPLIGSFDKDTSSRVVYWLPIPSEIPGAIIGLLSNLQPITVSPFSISAFNITFPRFPFVIPTEDHIRLTTPLNHVNANSDDFYLMHIPVNIKLTNDLYIKYATAEILSFKNNILIVYGVADSMAEIEFMGNGNIGLIHNDRKVQKSKNSKLEFDTGLFTSFTIPKEAPIVKTLMVNNQEIKIIIMSRFLSGRTWLTKHGIIMGVDLYNEKTNDISFTKDINHFYVFGNATLNRQFGVLRNDGIIRKMSVFHEYNINQPILLTLATQYIDKTDRDAQFTKLNKLVPCEEYNMTEGYITYKSEFDLTKIEKKNKLYIEHAADFITIFINNKYITSLAPIGGKIKSDDGHFRFRFKIPRDVLNTGANTLIIRADIWGRGSFIFPRGQVGYLPVFNHQIPLGFKIEMPMIGFDGIKGIYGKTTFNNAPLQWKYKINLLGEDLQYYKRQDGRKIQIPHAVANGQVEFVNFKVRLDNKLPLSLKLKGKDLKADVFMNGKILGRWISDEGWLQKSAYNLDRTALSLMDMDHFPIPSDIEELELSLLLESKGTKGRLELVEIGLAEEILKPNGSVESQYERKYKLTE